MNHIFDYVLGNGSPASASANKEIDNPNEHDKKTPPIGEESLRAKDIINVLKVDETSNRNNKKKKQKKSRSQSTFDNERVQRLLRRHQQPFWKRSNWLQHKRRQQQSIRNIDLQQQQEKATTSDENTPLLERISSNDSSSRSNSNRSKKNKQSGWDAIKKEVHRGNLLVAEEKTSNNDDLLNIGSHNSHRSSMTSYTSDTINQKSVEGLRKKAIEELQKGMTFSPQICVLAIILYMIVAVLMFRFVLEPQWTIIDSCYFAVSTFTTLGYGDLAPTNKISIIFTSIYALAGVACLGLALGIIGSNLLETHEEQNSHDDFTKEFEALTLFDHIGDDYSWGDQQEEESHSCYGTDDDEENDEEKQKHQSTPNSSSESLQMQDRPFPNKHPTGKKKVSFPSQKEDDDSIIGSNEDRDNTARSTTSGSTNSQDKRQSAKFIDTRKAIDVSLVRFFIIFGITLVFAFMIGHESGWSGWETVYYAVITACTIGYGDLTPHTQQERLLALFFIPLACAITGHCLAYFAHRIIERHGASHRKAMFNSKNELTLEDLQVMDITGDGKVSWFEFLEFMLVAMKKVDPELLDELRDYFDRLDVSGTGELSKDDLIEMARRKLRSPRRKLELYAYKQKLLQAGQQDQQNKGNHQGNLLERSLNFLGISTADINSPDRPDR